MKNIRDLLQLGGNGVESGGLLSCGRVLGKRSQGSVWASISLMPKVLYLGPEYVEPTDGRSVCLDGLSQGGDSDGLVALVKRANRADAAGEGACGQSQERDEGGLHFQSWKKEV